MNPTHYQMNLFITKHFSFTMAQLFGNSVLGFCLICKIITLISYFFARMKLNKQTKGKQSNYIYYIYNVDDTGIVFMITYFHELCGCNVAASHLNSIDCRRLYSNINQKEMVFIYAFAENHNNYDS